MAKAVVRGKFILLNAYIREEEKFISVILVPTSRNQEKKSKINPKQEGRKEIIRAEISEIEEKKSMKQKASLEKINKIDKS